MTEPLILDPLDGGRAFRDESAEAAWSQAAQLIGLGVQLRGDSRLLEGLASEAARLNLPRVSTIEPIHPARLEENLQGRQLFFEPNQGIFAPDRLRWTQV